MINNNRSLLELNSNNIYTQRWYMVESSADMLTIPVRIQILSSADNTTLLHNELDCILLDASSCCEYNAFVDNDGMTQIRIECISTKEEARYALEKLRSKNVSH